MNPGAMASKSDVVNVLLRAQAHAGNVRIQEIPADPANRLLAPDNVLGRPSFPDGADRPGAAAAPPVALPPGGVYRRGIAGAPPGEPFRRGIAGAAPNAVPPNLFAAPGSPGYGRGMAPAMGQLFSGGGEPYGGFGR